MRLLLVEDERKLSQVLAKGLKKLSYAVDQAFDGEEALELFSVYGYDLVVLDLNLPKIDGWEVLRQIRQQDRQVKVLILSAKNQVEDKIAGLDLGANDYLEKPFDFLELAARIRNLLRWEFVQRESQWEDGRLKMDFSAQTVVVDGKEIALTHKECVSGRTAGACFGQRSGLVFQYAEISYSFIEKETGVAGGDSE